MNRVHGIVVSQEERPAVVSPSYEPPRLTPIGNLHDLLAGDGGTSCDAVSGNPTAGHDNPGLC